ncbi:hypothetical protein [Sphingomonas sp. 3P27F8]|uniref:hypothetical protein n=1 Tax=Sphingomonas sp. 3P27F8 TaxID=2502213 RepID=UPI0010F44297|nr:hypothetical protein [Sphingomonas sp. 3P27F8]
MPNFFFAGFNVTGDPAELKRFTDRMFRPVVEADNALPRTELMFDFNHIIHMPATAAATNFRDWAIDNWGVVWSAIDLDYRFEEHNVWFQFTTAWDFPTPIFQALAAEFPSLVIAGSAYEEGHEVEMIGEFGGANDWGPGKIEWILGGPDDDDDDAED